ncbi:hypothetical protein MKW98_019694, partial [Papaver atlanticum]
FSLFPHFISSPLITCIPRNHRMEIMRSCAFTGPNLLRTPSNLYLPTTAKPILKKYQNSLVVKSLFFWKPPPQPKAFSVNKSSTYYSIVVLLLFNLVQYSPIR